MSILVNSYPSLVVEFFFFIFNERIYLGFKKAQDRVGYK